MPRRIPCLLVLFAVGVCSCELFLPPADPEPASPAIREAALAEAVRYVGMEYEWGGEDVMPRGIDCSGLVVNVYRYAASLGGYELLFRDATAADMAEHFTFPLEEPEPGDLVFMGDPAADVVSHVAIFDSILDAESMWVVDSTIIPELGIDGVTRRQRAARDGWIKGYGRMAVRPVR